MFKLLAKKTDRAFTILECLFAIVLVGIAVAALVAGNGSFTRVNSAAVELSTAEYLIQQIKELTDLLPGTDPDFSYMTFVASNDYDDVDDFQNRTFNPPITSDWQVLNEFSAYTQEVTVVRVHESNLEQVVYDNNAPFIRITVCIKINGREISSVSWIRARNY